MGQGTVRVLGPVEAAGPDGDAPLVGARQRAVLGLLALRVGTVVPTWHLIDALWGDGPPRTAVKSLHSHVARVRQALDSCGLPGVVVTREPGYVLALPGEAVDAWRFEEEVRRGRAELTGDDAPAAVITLRDALALWRHEVPLADAAPTGWAAGEVTRLSEVRLAATEDRWQAELCLGRHGAAIDELDRLLVAYPLRERLVGLLMLAQYRCGRHAAALDAFHHVKTRLADELGVDPSPELLRLHTQILRRDPGLDLRPAGAVRVEAGVQTAVPLPRPAQLPAPVGHFTGRVRELAALEDLLCDPGAEIPIAVVSGAAGAGKTALAVQWAHRVAERFPDGHLFVDLRGHEPDKALTASDALAHILRSLGVPADHTPTPVAEQAALYRSLLHGKRILLVLDNAASVDVVLPLVPAGAANMLLLTSRHTLAALATHHAVRAIGVEEFSVEEARALLVMLLGADRTSVETEATDELARLCGRLPLALRIGAAKLAGQPRRPIRDFVAELAGMHRLDALAVEGGSRSVRAVFASAYRVLNPVTARVFRLLGLHPGPTFTGVHAAAVTGLPLGVAERALDELITAHLVVGDGGDRFRFHDLIQLFAQQCATIDEEAGERGEAAARLVDWYVAVTDTANRAVDPGRNRVVPVLRHPPVHLPAMPDAPAALAVLDRERGNLVPIVRYAAEHGHPTAAWQLTYLLSGFYDSRGHWGERIELCRWGLAAARQLGDSATEGLMHSALSLAFVATRRFTDALEHLHAALPLMRTAGDRRGEGYVHNNIALAYCGLRRFDEGVEAFRRAHEVHAACGHDLGAALAQNNLGHAYVRMGRPELGMAALTAALATFRTLGNARLAAGTRHSLGEASLRLGKPADALHHLDQAVDAFRQIGDRWYEAEALNALGRAQLATGDHLAALDRFDQALKVAQDIADQNLEAIALGHIGQVLLRGGELAAARERLLLAVTLRLRVPDAYEEAHVHRDLGDLERRAGNVNSAEHHRELAIRLYRKANATDEADRLAAPAGMPAA